MQKGDTTVFWYAKAARDSQAFNRPQPTHREPSQERPQNQEDALGAKLYARKKKATQVPQVTSTSSTARRTHTKCLKTYGEDWRRRG